jgi:hypothetical protein
MGTIFTVPTDLATPPTQTDTNNFSSRGDTFLVALVDFVDELNMFRAALRNVLRSTDVKYNVYEWISGYTFAEGDAVTYEGHTYISCQGSNQGNDPTDAASLDYWRRQTATVDCIYDHGTLTSAVSLKGKFDTQVMTCTAVASLTVSVDADFEIGRTVVLVVTNGGLPTSITWPTTTAWSNGSEPSLSSSGVDRIVLTRQGSSTYHAALIGLDFK